MRDLNMQEIEVITGGGDANACSSAILGSGGMGSVIGGILGGVVGSIFPIVGTTAGAAIGSGIGGLVGGGAAAGGNPACQTAPQGEAYREPQGPYVNFLIGGYA